MFDNEVININSDNTGTTFTCSKCDGQVHFYIKDFDKHRKSNFSNLKESEFKGAPEGKEFLDFYCPQCNIPTTIIYSHSAGGQHGEYWYTIENVLN